MKAYKYIVISACEAVLVITTLILILSFTSKEFLQPSSIFSNGMVLQQQVEIPVSGKSTANTSITVSINDIKVSGQSDDNGNWELRLPAMKAGGPYTMSIKSSRQTIDLSDIYIKNVK
jgi:sialate O-acetylesterase